MKRLVATALTVGLVIGTAAWFLFVYGSPQAAYRAARTTLGMVTWGD